MIETVSDEVHDATEQVTANNQNDPLPDTVNQLPEEPTNNDGCTFEVINETNEAPIRVSMNELVDVMFNVEQQVNDIMDELRQDQVLWNILDQPENQPEDEGIEINPLDDIEYDIEPLDFDIEVENYTW